MTEGDWPEFDLDEDCTPVRSQTLEDGILRMMIGSNATYPKVHRAEVFYMYKAYAMTYPIKDVVAAMQTPERIKVLLEMYDTEELRPYMHLNRNLRGALLEETLGL